MIKCALFYSVAEHVLGELLDEKGSCDCLMESFSHTGTVINEKCLYFICEKRNRTYILW